jgi:hypothetical protein
MGTMRASALALLLVGSAHTAWAETTVVGLALPSRSASFAQLLARAKQAASQLALQPEMRQAQIKPNVELAALSRARALSLAGEVEQAATLFDAGLEEGARIPHRLADPSAYVSALIKRASLSLAHGEAARAQTLLERLLRYDPGATLLTGEASPPVRAMLDQAAKRMASAPNVKAQEFGEACQEADVVFLARSLGSQGIELLRFDHCQRVALDAPLARAPAPPALRSPTRSRALRYTAGALTGVTIATSAIGLGLYLSARSIRDGLRSSCPADNCPVDMSQTIDDGRTRERAAYGLLGAAALLAVADVGLWIAYGRRPSERRPPHLAWTMGASF